MDTPATLNELNSAENSARELLERIECEYVPREVLARRSARTSGRGYTRC